jgi:hypothetical protein
MESQTLVTAISLAGIGAGIGTGLGTGIGAGMDFVCVALTLAYISKLLFQNISIGNPIAGSCAVAKVSLRGQQVARRMR